MPRKRTRKITRARSLRESPTKSERLLWSILRGKQLGNLKFRRQHPIGPFFADFACTARRLVIEIDGGCHDQTGQSDLDREAYLREDGWEVVRFTDSDVEQDADAVAREIAVRLGLLYQPAKRKGTGSGMENANAPHRQSN